MSRMAASQAAKKDQKANLAEKTARKAHESELGLTSAIKTAIGADVCLCTVCGATQMGPLTVCECKGGKVRPGPNDEGGIVQLIAAAKARQVASDKIRNLERGKEGAAVQKERAGRKELNGQLDLTAEFQGDGIEIVVNAEFPVGKLGMELEKNCVSKVTGDPAVELKVQVGWVVHKIDGDIVEPPTKQAIGKATMKAMKKGPVVFGFRVPITEGYQFCNACNKFQDAAEFEGAQLKKGPGLQLCSPCEQCEDMGDFGD